MYAAGVAAVQEEFDERGLGPADLLVRVIVDEALASIAASGDANAPAEGQEQPVESGMDDRLALGTFVDRCERSRIAWAIWHEPTRTPQHRYELRAHEGPARGIYRGSTATMAATAALAALDEHRIGWDEAAPASSDTREEPAA